MLCERCFSHEAAFLMQLENDEDSHDVCTSCKAEIQGEALINGESNLVEFYKL